MLAGEGVRGPSIAVAWERGLELFAVPTRLYRHDSERGVAFEIPGLSVFVESVADVSLPGRFAYPPLVTQYTERLSGSLRHESLLHDRLRRWPAVDGRQIDQVATVTSMLKTNPDTRSATFSFWRPEADQAADFPVTPVAGCFRIIERAVHLQLLARSVDYWVGAVPEMVAFADLQAAVAAELGLPTGSMTFHMWSAHIYEGDCLAHVAEVGR